MIDNSGYVPRIVNASAELLAKNASQYIFISSISAYGENPAEGGDENTKLATLADPTVETMGDQFQNYGGLKVLCEQAALAAFPNKKTWTRLQKNGMRADFSWDRSAGEYVKMYQALRRRNAANRPASKRQR